MVNQRHVPSSRCLFGTDDSGSSASSSTYTLPSINYAATSAAATTAAPAATSAATSAATPVGGHIFDLSLIDDVDFFCKRDPEFLSVLPKNVRSRVLRIWAEDVKDYRFYGEETEDEEKDFDTEVRTDRGQIGPRGNPVVFL